jgi:hypothetical protein
MSGQGKPMDFSKIILYLNILGICLPIAVSYEVIANIICGLPVKPVTIVVSAFGYAIMLKQNPLFQELKRKWFNKRK